jgi:hypothetical protein
MTTSFNDRSARTLKRPLLWGGGLLFLLLLGGPLVLSGGLVVERIETLETLETPVAAPKVLLPGLGLNFSAFLVPHETEFAIPLFLEYSSKHAPSSLLLTIYEAGPTPSEPPPSKSDPLRYQKIDFRLAVVEHADGTVIRQEMGFSKAFEPDPTYHIMDPSLPFRKRYAVTHEFPDLVRRHAPAPVRITLVGRVLLWSGDNAVPFSVTVVFEAKSRFRVMTWWQRFLESPL